MWKTFLIGKPECHRLNVRVNSSDRLLLWRSLNRTLSVTSCSMTAWLVLISAKKQARSLNVLAHGYGLPRPEELQNFKCYINSDFFRAEFPHNPPTVTAVRQNHGNGVKSRNTVKIAVFKVIANPWFSSSHNYNWITSTMYKYIDSCLPRSLLLAGLSAHKWPCLNWDLLLFPIDLLRRLYSSVRATVLYTVTGVLSNYNAPFSCCVCNRMTLAVNINPWLNLQPTTEIQWMRKTSELRFR